MAISIKELLGERSLRLRSVTDEDLLQKRFSNNRVQKPGLILTGNGGKLKPDTIQVLGESEIIFLNTAAGKDALKALKIIEDSNPIILIITKGIEAPQSLLDFVKEHSFVLLATTLTTSNLISRLSGYLEDKTAPTETIHGVFLDVLGMGVLITGSSAMGKSECALDLIGRGHQLVADDAVIVKRHFPSTLIGTSAEQIRHFIEVRGIGIMNVKELFGITAIREKKQLDFVVQLVPWDKDTSFDRLGFDEETFEILGLEVPINRIPIIPGRSTATLVEAAARNQLSRLMGYSPMDELQARVSQSMEDAVLSPGELPGEPYDKEEG